MTRVHVVAGFLGAGKTSTIRSLLASLPESERVAVIVNDFGEASLDARMVGEGAQVTVREIDGRCVCCTAPEGLVGAIGSLLAEEPPDRILIEPTGLARPADLLDTLRRSPHASSLSFGPLVVLVDPTQLDPETLSSVPLLQSQAEVADVLVANRTDLAGDAAMERFERWAENLWPGPLMIERTTHGRIPVDRLDWPEGQGPRRQGVRHHHPEDSVAGFSVRSWIWTSDQIFSRKRLELTFARILRGELGARVARAKGVFNTDEGVCRLDVAGGKIHLAVSDYRRDSRLDVILHGSDTPPGAWARMAGWLTEAVATEDELALDANKIEIVVADGRVLYLDRDALIALPDGVEDISVRVPGRSGSAAEIRALIVANGLPIGGEVVVVAADGFVSPPVPTRTLAAGLLLHSIDGAPLSPDKGGPIRLLMPEDAGPAGPCSNVKGVVRLVFRLA